ncbi:MAG TPA: hypothetical protein VLS27_13875, partial [Gammaproteobacteria bacterium]|nr:hypothetical protein [Gammaproteobacteria bacterium]
IRITGYGTTGAPAPLEWSLVQKTHTGPFVTSAITTVQYQTDTTGGNSGSPIVDETTGLAIGIHTHGGCFGDGSGANSGTAIDHPDLQLALENPTGVCIPPQALAFEFPDGLPELISPFNGSIRVNVLPTEFGSPQPGTGVLVVSTTVGGGISPPGEELPMEEIAPNQYRANFPEMTCGAKIDYHFKAETATGEVVSLPFNAPANTFEADAATELDAAFRDTFETDSGWTVLNSAGLTAGAWERGVPVGGGDRGDPPADADRSGQCYLTMNLDGDSDVDNGSTTLISPVLDATEGDAHIVYSTWFSNVFGNAPFSDVMTVEVSPDGGGSWVLLETIGPTGAQVSGDWFDKSFRIADFITPTDQFMIRFTAEDAGDGSVVEAGVDDVRINRTALGLLCLCSEDLDGNGSVGSSDLLAVLAGWGTPSGDINGDGTTGSTDLLALLAAWGPCP